MPQDIRPLTHDERKAAEAAFKGTPFDPKWSDAARKVYLGLSSAMANTPSNMLQDVHSSSARISAKPAIPESKVKSRIKSTFL